MDSKKQERIKENSTVLMALACNIVIDTIDLAKEYSIELYDKTLTSKPIKNVPFLKKYSEQAEERVLFAKWLADFTKDEKPIAEQLLNNQWRHLRLSIDANKSCHFNKEAYMNLTVQLIHKIFKLRPLISIQPLSRPVDPIYLLQYNFDKTNISLNVASHPIEALSRKTDVRYSLELAQDLRALHGINTEKELSNIVSSELYNDIVFGILSEIHTISEKIQATQEEAMHPTVFWNKISSRICHDTRRGPGKYIIMPMEQWMEMCSQNTSPIKMEMYPNATPGAISHVGKVTHNDTTLYEIYATHWTPPNIEPNQKWLLMGYKGDSEIDAGFVYSPYILQMPSGVVIDPTTFAPEMIFFTRYGLYKDDEISPKYYKFVTF